MKKFNAAKLVGLGVLSLSLATLPVVNSASAQDANTSGTTTTATTTNDRGFSWGWLGLLGLAGLAGLAGGKRRYETTATYQDPTVTSSTTTTNRPSDY